MNINQLLELASDTKISLTDVLFKLKILVSSLNNSEINQWIEYEINGYPKENQLLPNYRKHNGILYGNIANIVARHTNHPLPVNLLDEKLKKHVTNFDIYLSISSIEAGEEGMIRIIDPSFYTYLTKGIDNSFHIEYAYVMLSITNLKQTLSNIRSKIIDILLNTKNILGGEAKITEDKLVRDNSYKISNSIVNIIYGNQNSINSADTQNQLNISINNWEDLEKYLLKNKVEKEEIDEIKNIIDKEEIKENKINKIKVWLDKLSIPVATGAILKAIEHFLK